jgi:cytochrome c peroxidase
MHIPADNPMTIEGVALGRKLFYDPSLSKNNIQSCGTCHSQPSGFSDHGNRFSQGADGLAGTRNAMALINVGWEQKFFWDGRAASLEAQIFGPVTNPVEMNTTWPEVEQKLNASAEYPELFRQAFNIDHVDSVHVSMAIAQFLRSLVSGNSKFDKFRRGEVSLTPSELSGFDIYRTERGDCFHCHPFETDGTLTDHTFKNNGLDSDAGMTDPGLQDVTGDPNDRGKFKVPTLRNIELTAPYMHDGRFATLEEVVEHYDTGGESSSTVDPLMKHVGVGLNLTLQDRIDLVNFLKTFTDEEFISNPEFGQP